MKKIILFLMVLFTTGSYAQSDFEIAQSFMNEKGVKLVPNDRSTTRGTDAPYSIFNGSEGKGFCIVSNGNVIGYDTENTVEDDNVSCCFKELLNVISKTVTTSKTRGLTARNVVPIKPMIRTKWSCGSPYTDSIYYKSNICFYIAKAQILHYIKVNFYIEDHFLNSNKRVDLYPTTFDHDLIDREGEKGWAEETARFFKYVRFGDSSATWEGGYEVVFRTKEETEEFNKYNSRYRIYDRILEMGNPMLVSAPNHGFIIDGRSEDGKYHVNFGWGGSCDGYYMFPDTENDKQYINDNMEHNREAYYWAKYYTSLNEGTTIIPTIKAQINNAVYNLQGIKVGNSLNGLPKGVYIQGGKKYIVK